MIKKRRKADNFFTTAVRARFLVAGVGAVLSFPLVSDCIHAVLGIFERVAILEVRLDAIEHQHHKGFRDKE
jgi:hypothetical protein